MKNKKVMMGISIAICLLLIILLIISVVLKRSKNNVVNNVNQTISNLNNIQNNEVENIVDEPIITKTANQVFKEKLLNKKWVQDNLYLKTDCFGKKIENSESQTVKYIKIQDETFSNPIVLIYTNSDLKISNQLYYITYNNGNITTKSLSENATHNAHTSYNVNGRLKILYKSTTYSDYEEYDIYKITDKGLNKIYNIKQMIKREKLGVVIEYYNNNKKIDEAEYNSIKNQYIQDSARKDDFKILSLENLNNSFN